MNLEKDTCYHCGDPCLGSSLRFDDKDFCCRGCKTVYEILTENDLVEYYSIEKSPGIKNEDKERFSDYAFLDIPEIRKELLTFSANNFESVTFPVPGIHCSSCIYLLENLHQLNPAIIKAEVNFLKKQVFIQYNSEKISLRQLAELLDSIGYKPLVELQEKERARANKRKDMTYIYKLGISGFAFGNIMLLSFPEYFSGGMYDDKDFGIFFGYINMIFALPVFFYCSSSYFISAWKGLKSKYLNIDVPISLGILVLFLRSLYEVLSQEGPGYFDSMTGLVFFLLVGRWFQNRTYQALSFERDYKSYFPLGVTRVRGENRESILLKDIEVGDEVLIHNGEIIPADGLLVNGKASIDYSFVTGEALPMSVDNGQQIFAGGRQIGEMLQIKIEKKFSQSYLMQLWKFEEKTSLKDQNLSNTIDRVSQYFTAIILLIAVGSGLFWWIYDPGLAFHAIGSVLIIACPCALALTIPFTFGNGMRRLEKAGIYLRDARFIEVLSKIDTIVFDKTGTITSQQGKKAEFVGQKLSPDEIDMVKTLTKNSGHPLSRIIYESLNGKDELTIEEFSEIEGKGLRGKVFGKKLLLGSEEFVGMKKEVPGTKVYLKIENKERGVFSISNEYRKGLEEVVSALKKTYELAVITGDGDSEKANLKKYFGKNVTMRFSMNPFEKREYISELKKNGKQVMMIGDGLNDAGAIKESDIGISISDDIYGFLPSCDAIMESKSFNKICQTLNYSKQMKNLVLSGFVISFLYNIVGLSFAIQGILSPIIAAILMPISSVTVVSFAIFMTDLKARKNKIL